MRARQETIRELAARTGLSLSEASRFRTLEVMRANTNQIWNAVGVATAFVAIVGLGLATAFHP